MLKILITPTNSKLPGLNAKAPPHVSDRDRLRVTEQLEIGCNRNALEHREEAIPPISFHADSAGKPLP